MPLNDPNDDGWVQPEPDVEADLLALRAAVDRARCRSGVDGDAIDLDEPLDSFLAAITSDALHTPAPPVVRRTANPWAEASTS
jgi:hypothetical protein